MSIFNIYCDLMGEGANIPLLSEDFDSQAEADSYAWEQAIEHYDRYAGLYGMPTWFDCAVEFLVLYGKLPESFKLGSDESYNIVGALMEEGGQAYENAAEELYNEYINAHIDYYAVLAEDDENESEENEDDY